MPSASLGARALGSVMALGLFATGAAAADVKTIFDQPAQKENWYVIIGASGVLEPDYAGSSDYRVLPGFLFSLSKESDLYDFHSIDDSPSIAVLDTGRFAIGLTGNLDWGRDADDSDRLRGMGNVSTTIQMGGFAEWFPAEWLRLRGALFYATGGYEGLLGSVKADFIYNAPGGWGFAVGPRLYYAGTGYMDAYFGVTPVQSFTTTALVNPTPPYAPSAGFNQLGITAQVTKELGNGFTAGMYGTYLQLLGSAAASPLTEDINQFEAGVSLTYSFNIGKGVF